MNRIDLLQDLLDVVYVTIVLLGYDVDVSRVQDPEGRFHNSRPVVVEVPKDKRPIRLVNKEGMDNIKEATRILNLNKFQRN